MFLSKTRINKIPLAISSLMICASMYVNINGDAASWSYYPYGSEMTMTAPSQLTTNPDWQAYRFSGKELIRQNGLNMYDFGARLFDVAGVPMWTSMDPLAEKYYHLNPYLYCAGDPVNKFDPDGMDEWNVNNKGYLEKVKETDEHDAFFMIDSNGQRIEGKELALEYGTIEKMGSLNNKNGNPYLIIKSRGDEKSTQLFEFLAENTRVEWSQAKLGEAGDLGLNYLTTSHDEAKNSGSFDFIDKQLSHGYTIREMNHSHPNNTPTPSWKIHKNSGDIPFAKYVLEKTKQDISFNIYLPENKRYIKYGPQFVDLVYLNEIIITK